MTEHSTDRTSAPGFILLLLVLVVTGVAYVCQSRHVVKYEGTYPAVKPMVKAEFSFRAEKVTIKLSEQPIWERVVVFVYDEEGRQVGILKPVYDQTVIIKPGESPDYRVSFTDGAVDDFEIITKINGVYEGEDFFSLLTQARKSSRRYGVQECLYPFCTLCMDVCPVIKQGVIEMRVAKNGTIYPVINIGGCPRCGKCFEVCKVGVIFKSTLIHSQMTLPRTESNSK